MRFEITMPYAGIYYISKDGSIPFQIIVSQEMNQNGHIWLTALTRNLTVNHAKLLVEASNELTSQGEKELANSVLQISVDANGEQFLKLKGENGMEALRKIMQPEIDAAAREAMLIGEARGEARGEAKGEAKGKRIGEITALVKLVEKGLLSTSVAAEQLGISETKFRSYLN